MKMFVLVLAGSCDISRLEALHAWVRKHLVLRAQTHGLNIDDLGAFWVFGRNRSCLRRAGGGKPPIRKRPAAQAQSPEQPAAKKAKFKANSWNLFCRQFVAENPNPGQRKDWSAASDAWGKLEQKEKDELKLRRDAAKARAKAFGLKGSIFGVKASRMAAMARKAAERQQTEGQLLSLGGQVAPPALQANAFDKEQMSASSASLEDLHRKATQLERKGWGKKQAEERKAKKLIDDWIATQSDIKDGLILSHPEATPQDPGNQP